ncbi:MAG: hypothetical protein WD801_04030 [Gemmatimonadaceae bacterium]
MTSRRRVVRWMTLVAAAACTEPTAPQLPDRFVDDRPDDFAGPQVHVMYVLPSDAADLEFDLNGTLATSVASFSAWFAERSGLAIRFDTHDGALDVTGFRLDSSDEEMKALGPSLLFGIESRLDAAGKLAQDKIYLVYYDGTSTYACGGASWPGRIAAMYLRGLPSGANCGLQQFVSSPTQFPRYWEFAALHDLHHTFGIVSPNAPHHTVDYPAHVPEENDLLYSGPGPWIINATTVIDVDGDDYFGANVPAGVANLSLSPFVAPAQGQTRVAWQHAAPEADAMLRNAVEHLPVHVPFTRTPQRDRR